MCFFPFFFNIKSSCRRTNSNVYGQLNLTAHKAFEIIYLFSLLFLEDPKVTCFPATAVSPGLQTTVLAF